MVNTDLRQSPGKTLTTMIRVRIDADDMGDVAALAAFDIRSRLRHDLTIICEGRKQPIDAAIEVATGRVRGTLAA